MIHNIELCLVWQFFYLIMEPEKGQLFAILDSASKNTE